MSKFSLRELESRNPAAFAAYVEVLIEDCQDSFSVDDAGLLRVVVGEDSPFSQDGIEMLYVSGCWVESSVEEDEDDTDDLGEPCSFCDGEGQIGNDECESCEGTGVE